MTAWPQRVLAALVLLGSATSCGGGGDPPTAVLRADGDAESVAVRFSLNGEEHEVDAVLPWESEVELADTFAVELVVENSSETGQVECTIARVVRLPIRAVGEASATCQVQGRFSSDGVSGEANSSSERRPVVAPTTEEYSEAGLELVSNRSDIVILGLPEGWRIVTSSERNIHQGDWTELHLDELIEAESASGETILRVFVERDVVDSPPLPEWTAAVADLYLDRGFVLTPVAGATAYQGDGLGFSGSNPLDEVDVLTYAAGEDLFAIVALHPPGTAEEDEVRVEARTIAAHVAFDPGATS